MTEIDRPFNYHKTRHVDTPWKEWLPMYVRNHLSRLYDNSEDYQSIDLAFYDTYIAALVASCHYGVEREVSLTIL